MEKEGEDATGKNRGGRHHIRLPFHDNGHIHKKKKKKEKEVVLSCENVNKVHTMPEFPLTFNKCREVFLP